MKETTSKTMDGISDLVVFAPIREGFIKAFETITYASRLELVANALNRLRIAAREYERVTPFTDVTERILSLLDFRVGVIDEDLFGLARGDGDKLVLKPKRYLYLTATFEGGFEPYMRQIWRPLGPFLDLLFCNCEGYITATKHSFDEYVQWVRDNQMDSAIFYNTTGITVRDQKYLSSLERAQRAEMLNGVDPADLWARDEVLASHAMSYPDDDAAKARSKHPRKATELGFEALNVLFKLTDYYPPEWLTGDVAGTAAKDGEGHFLIRATRELLRGWDGLLAAVEAQAKDDPKGQAHRVLQTYREPVEWYRSGSIHISGLDAAPVKPDPLFEREQVQSGILKAHGSREKPVSHGALMLFTVRNADAARRTIGKWVEDGVIQFGDAAAIGNEPPVFANIAFSSLGMLELGIDYPVHDCLPKEFREGLAQRTSQVGDLRENHPRNWILPERNGAAFLVDAAAKLPPVQLEEVDFVIQLRGFDADSVRDRAHELGLQAAPGATLESIEWLHVQPDDSGRFRDHFGFVDGLSQPRPKIPDDPAGAPVRDRVALGEVLVGYGNDRGDGPPELFEALDDPRKPRETNTAWRNKPRTAAMNLLRNGSFVVIRKIGEDVAAFEAWLDREKRAIAVKLDIPEDEARARLKAAIMGRDHDGSPLVPTADPSRNDFDYQGDGGGVACPHAAHIRRANPRRWNPSSAAPTETRREFGRPSPRLVRRGMLFGEEGAPRGLVFVAYAASIAEQYEVIQRWLNGGNPTDVASANNDPLTGVRAKDGPNTFRFMSRRRDKRKVVVRVELPPASGDGAQPGRHPFTPLFWGLYLFTPSRAALKTMTTTWQGGFKPLREMLERAVGLAWIDRLAALSREEAAKEWKRLIEDFVAKDPSERDISPHLFAAIRYGYDGALDLRTSLPKTADDSSTGQDADNHDWTKPPSVDTQNIILCTGRANVSQVLSDWENFTSEEQLRRIFCHAGPIYVTQQPDNVYMDKSGRYDNLNYHEESSKTNAILFAYDEDEAFLAGYRAGAKVLTDIKAALESGATSFKAELRRQYIQPAIAELWKIWYGLPDEKALHTGGWSWKKLVATVSNPDAERSGALCPGDFMAPSRGAVFPRPNPSINHYARDHGAAIRKAGLDFVEQLHAGKVGAPTPLIKALFDAYPQVAQKEVLARNIVGTMIGAIPPMDANLRNILLEWLLERRLWRYQSAFKLALDGKGVEANAAAARAVLEGPISQAMCKRPAPDLLFRTAKRETHVAREDDDTGTSKPGAIAKERDLVIVSLASASQRSFNDRPNGDVSVIFGGKRDKPLQGYDYDEATGAVTHTNDGAVHACPAQKMAMGGMTGILAALLDAGTIQALPASLIVRISDW